ncbi:phage tail sheath family protein [Cellulomonas sp. NPDC055163]
MSLTSGLRTSGHPGVYVAPAPPDPALGPVRLDVTGFAGVAPRGPTDLPVLVTRWSDYEEVFGAYERPPGTPERLLPHAVASFFRQGGQRAWVLRVAPHGDVPIGAAEATATYALGADGPVLAASSEGTWGGRLSVRLRYDVVQRTPAEHEGPATLRVPVGAAVTVGTLLRLHSPTPSARGGSDPVLRWVTVLDEHVPRGAPQRLTLDSEVAVTVGTALVADVVVGVLDVEDRSAPGRRGEHLTGLGLRPEHPRWLARVLTEGLGAGGGRSPGVAGAGPESRVAPHLLVPLADWSAVMLTPRDVTLPPVDATARNGGADRSHLVGSDAFFDPSAGDLGPEAEDDDFHGVDRLARVGELGLLCVPDLTWRSARVLPPPEPWTPPRPRTHCSACDPPDPGPSFVAPAKPQPALDARVRDERDLIAVRQGMLAEVTRRHARFVALLDVPDGLSVSQISAWRAGFDSSYLAAYHPWLAVPTGTRGVAVAVPPSAFAAGIIGARERRLGLPWGPANELARGAVLALSPVDDAVHDRLHALGINVYREERDGFRLAAGRTLSSDPDFRQLSVRRMMTMIRLALERQTQWLVFEPHTAALRASVVQLVTGFLRGLARQGAFAGRTEAESFFVRAGEDVNPPAEAARGRLVVEVGLALASPLEFIMVRIARDPDGTTEVSGDVG